jgi:hypothetical protein
MKRLIVGALSILLVSLAVAPAAKAQVRKGNDDTQMNSISKQVPQITPFNLVYRAYQGDFSEQGIPGYTRLLTAYRFGEINPEDLVKSAVRANRLPPSTLSDESYLSAVRFYLRDLSRIER